MWMDGAHKRRQQRAGRTANRCLIRTCRTCRSRPRPLACGSLSIAILMGGDSCRGRAAWLSVHGWIGTTKRCCQTLQIPDRPAPIRPSSCDGAAGWYAPNDLETVDFFAREHFLRSTCYSSVLQWLSFDPAWRIAGPHRSRNGRVGNFNAAGRGRPVAAFGSVIDKPLARSHGRTCPYPWLSA